MNASQLNPTVIATLIVLSSLSLRELALADGCPEPSFDAGPEPLGSIVGQQITSLVVGDFNGDGRKDLAVTTLNSLLVLLGKGDGTFQTAVNYTVGANRQRPPPKPAA